MILFDSYIVSPVHVLMLSIEAVHGFPRLRAPGIVPCDRGYAYRYDCLAFSFNVQIDGVQAILQDLFPGGARAEFAIHNCPVAWCGTYVGVGGHVREPVQSWSEGCILPTRAYVRAQPQVDHYGGAVWGGEQAHHGVERRPHGHDCPQSCSGDSNYSPLTSYR